MAPRCLAFASKVANPAMYRYAFGRMLLSRHPSRLLRVLLLACVVAGLALQPVIAALGDLHELEHRSVIEDGHGHAHGLDGHHHHAEEPADGDGSHGVSVLHGLLHSCSGASATALFDPPTVICPNAPKSDPPRVAPDRGPIASHPTSPFRPPIV